MPLPSTMTPIATYTVDPTAPPTSIVFSSISQDYTDLKLVFTFTPTASLRSRFTLNGDTGTNYSSTLFSGDGSTTTSNRYSNAPYVTTYNTNNTGLNLLEVNFLSYSNSTTYKSFTIRHSVDTLVCAGVGLYRSTSPITSISLAPNVSTYAAATTATLYGIKAAS